MINGIYNSVQQMLRLHLDCCLSMPRDVRQRIEQLKSSCSSRGGRKQYWIGTYSFLKSLHKAHTNTAFQIPPNVLGWWTLRTEFTLGETRLARCLL